MPNYHQDQFYINEMARIVKAAQKKVAKKALAKKAKGYEPLIPRELGKPTHFNRTCDRIKATNEKYRG